MTLGADLVEPWRSKYRRRAMTIPVMLVSTAVALAMSPLMVPMVIVADLLRGRRKLPLLRGYAFLTQYGVNDSVEILLAGPLWLRANFGRSLNSLSSQRRHERLQAWSLGLLARRTKQLLGIEIEVTGDDLGKGPAIVLCRHVSLLDASLPSLIYQSRGVHSRGVVMAELLADPGFDLLYQRTGSTFVNRDGSAEGIERVATLAGTLNDSTVAVIFPEGRLFRPEALASRLGRLAEKSPERYQRLRTLKHSLPPRPGGFMALLAGAPSADVVVVNHHGLEAFPRFTDLLRSAPCDLTVAVSVRRYSRSSLPLSQDELIEWLDDIWVELDIAVATQAGRHAS